jgi:hypothetical protein
MLTSNRAHAAKLNVFSGAIAVFAMRPGSGFDAGRVRRSGFGLIFPQQKLTWETSRKR